MDFSTVFSDQNIILFFFKASAILLSLLYFVYSIVLYKQTQVKVKALRFVNANILLTISLIQILVSIFFIILAFIV